MSLQSRTTLLNPSGLELHVGSWGQAKGVVHRGDKNRHAS